jgi:hypothetical protein
MKITSIAQVQASIAQPLETVAKGVYNVPGWPTVAMDRRALLKWANTIGASAIAAAPIATSLIAAAKAQYRSKAKARSKAQAAHFAAMLVA